MTDKEFKRLKRSQLIDIIYQLQLKEDELIEENKRLKAALEDKRIRIDQAGSIAEAAIGINDVIQAAQNAAEQYLNEIEMMHANVEQTAEEKLLKEMEQMRLEVEQERQRILQRTQEEAAAIIAHTKRMNHYSE